MATQLLNADAQLSSIKDLLGHSHITTTQRYCRVANLKVQRDYYKAMEVVLQRTQALEEDEDDDDRQSTGRAQENRTPRQRERIDLPIKRSRGTCTRLRPQKNTLPFAPVKETSEAFGRTSRVPKTRSDDDERQKKQ
jgi:hypothetical protein